MSIEGHAIFKASTRHLPMDCLQPHYLYWRARVVIVILIGLSSLSACQRQPDPDTGFSQPTKTIRFAVLGNSDSHSYGDRVLLPEGSGKRGGQYRYKTLQWTEILDRLRGTEIDQGKWGSRGHSPLVTKLFSFIGVHLRSPEKEDYEYNFAWSGAGCDALTSGVRAQSKQLVQLMQEDPDSWQHGVIQIRIGTNNLGFSDFLNRAAAEGLTPAIHQEVTDCVGHITATVNLVRQQFPQVHFLLIGILNNSDWPPYFGFWQSRDEQQKINLVLDDFDNQLRELATTDKHAVFFDDRAWFRRYWGGRDSNGKPDYKVFNIAHDISVSNTQGDTPEHGVLKDGHAGTLVNALLVRDFIDFLNQEFELHITPVSQTELNEFSRGIMKQ